MARNSLKSLIKTGFGLSVGFLLARMIFVLIGMAFFFPGYLMYKKATDKKESSSQIGGMILMGIGVVIMGGIGFGALLDSAGDMFSD
jgi:accessory gene regulator protein AgrB